MTNLLLPTAMTTAFLILVAVKAHEVVTIIANVGHEVVTIIANEVKFYFDLFVKFVKFFLNSVSLKNGLIEEQPRTVL